MNQKYIISKNIHYEEEIKNVPILPKLFFILSLLSLMIGIGCFTLFNNVSLFLCFFGLCFVFMTLTCMTAMKLYKDLIAWSLIIVGIIIITIGISMLISTLAAIIYGTTLFIIACPTIGIIVLISGYKKKNKIKENNEIEDSKKIEKDAKVLIIFGWTCLIVDILMFCIPLLIII